MKVLIQLLLILFVVVRIAKSQPDLMLNQPMLVNPTSLHIGQDITVSFQVQNFGTQSAGACHIGVYISPTANKVDAQLMGEIYLGSLSSGTSSDIINYKHPIPYNMSIGSAYIFIQLDDLNEIPGEDESNNENISSAISLTDAWAEQHIPYPMIFIHGLIGDDHAWDELIGHLKDTYGWSFGGRMDFCLNQDANYETSNHQVDYQDYTVVSALNPADLYTINFDVDNYGVAHDGIDVGSNQSAIVKQGYAIKDAIAHVLQVTGKDKVILVGHSMGGLAAREYLQESSLWHPYTSHKVGRLCTIGTPHGGSNATDFGLFGVPTDLNSEAVRDLRTSYLSGNLGVYLFGGEENLDYMDDFLFGHYYNPDVNCNGVTNETITGLNMKTIPTDLTYSCIIGVGDKLGGDSDPLLDGDGIVTADKANINSWSPLANADTFILDIGTDESLSEVWHTELEKQLKTCVQALDEPNNYNNNHAFDVILGQLYYGLMNTQSLASGNTDSDYDNYKVNIPSDGNLTIKIYNITISQFKISIYNSSSVSVYSIQSNGKSFIDAITPIEAGVYYVVFDGIPTSNSWLSPYAFELIYTPNSSSCIGTTNLTLASSTISDGSGISDYNNDLNCKWLISPAGATSITLSFSSFSTQLNKDKVKVYDGPNDSSPLIGVFSGSSIPSPITSTGGNMLIKFNSDPTVTGEGWNASYTAVIPQPGDGIVSYEYWFDDNYTSKVTSVVTDGPNFSLNEPIPTTGVATGLHSFHIRFLDDKGLWSSVVSQFFQKLPVSVGGANSIVAYEYWFDNDYDNKVLTTITAQTNYNLSSALSAIAIPDGLHSMHIRFKDNRGTWSSVVSQFFQKLAPSNGLPNLVTAYRYWFNQESANMVNVNLAVPTNPYDLITDIATTGLPNGTHTANFQFKDTRGYWSSVLTDTFSKSLSAPKISLVLKTGVICPNTGSIDIKVTKGVSPYTYLWSNGAITQDLTGLASGTYTVTVTGANGASSTDSYNVSQSNIPKPKNLSATNVTSCSATLNWQAVSGITEYKVRYRITGTTEWSTPIKLGNQLSYSFLNLLPNTSYDLSVASKCSGSATTGNYAIITSTTLKCTAPINITATSITSSSALISWTGVCSPVSYKINYKPLGGSFTTVNVTSSPKTINGLSPSTTYEYQVKAVCAVDNSQYSTLQSFTTSPLKDALTEENDLNAYNVSIYPNPTSGNFVLSFTNPLKEKVSVELVNILGQKVQKIFEGTTETKFIKEINGNELPSAMYYVEIAIGSERITRKLVIER